MINIYITLIKLITLTCCISLSGCTTSNIVEDNMKFADSQLRYALTCIADIQHGSLTNPRSTNPDGSLLLVPSRDWTSGFFPGELWYLYEYTQDDFWRTQAEKHTEILEQEKLNAGTHDMGFKMYCSYGNGYRLTDKKEYRDILLQSARTLTTRFVPAAGIIRSWDHNRDKWQCPVIIDNMMNLELLFWAFRETQDSTFYKIAVTHACTTLKNHFREDYSTWHVIDYDTITGNVLKRNTHQGYADNTSWARGQAWALYGYTLCYRETGMQEFLEQAKRVENFIFTHKNLPDDLIPFWDFNAPHIPDEPRDASAAAIIASALYELSLYVDSKSDNYMRKADRIIEKLSLYYRAKPGTENGFLLLHSTGDMSHKAEIDTSIIYADYYFMEALIRKSKHLANKSKRKTIQTTKNAHSNLHLPCD